MKTNQKCLKNLQTALSMELAAVNQYMLHAHALQDWGLDSLAAKMRAEMLEELGHAGDYIDRIMFLKGAPQVEPAKAPQLAGSLEEMFRADLADEEQAIAFYAKAAGAAAEANDIGTRTLFERIALDEEGNKAWLEQQLEILHRIGEAAYFSRHMSVAGPEA